MGEWRPDQFPSRPESQADNYLLTTAGAARITTRP